MAIFKVEGGRRLRGEITPQGAKNEALQILCATLLTQEKVIVHNVPQILDVIQLIELLQATLRRRLWGMRRSDAKIVNFPVYSGV